jgi:hypothetical protein
MQSGRDPGSAEPIGSALKYTASPSLYQKQSFGYSGPAYGPAYVFPLAAAAMLQASSVAIRTKEKGHLVPLLGPHA